MFAVYFLPFFSVSHIVLALVFCTLTLFFSGCSQFADSASDENALHQTSDMLLIALRRHGSDIPASWKDLRQEYELTQPGYNNFSFQELQDRIEIDFNSIKNLGREPCTVIRVKGVKGMLSSMEQAANVRLEDGLLK